MSLGRSARQGITHALADVGFKVLVSSDVDAVTAILEVLGGNLVVLAWYSRDDDIRNREDFGKSHGDGRGDVMRVELGRSVDFS